MFWRRTDKTDSSPVRRFYSNPDSKLAKPPGVVGKICAQMIVITILMISVYILTEYSRDVKQYEDRKCPINWGDNAGCSYEQYTSNDIGKKINGFLMTPQADLGMEVGDNLPHGNTPDGPWYWLYYVTGSMVVISGIRLASKRRTVHQKSLRAAEYNMRPIVRKLALDPNGVVEGRISLPNPIQSSHTSKKEERRIMMIYFFTALIMITTVMAMYSYFDKLNSGIELLPKHDAQAFLLMSMALGFTFVGQISIKYLLASYEGEDDSIIPQDIREQYRIAEDERRSNLSDEPASAEDVLEALSREMKEAREETEFLRSQLIETRIKVSDLETELEQKSMELESIQAISADMEKIVEENNNAGDKSLSLMDSVMVGDNLFSGDKIDKQIINDPKAIARAAIEAYKEGQKDRGTIDLDFD